MNLSVDELRSLYKEVIYEYNKTPLAVDDGFFARYEEHKFLEVVECAKYLPSNNATFLDIGTGMGIAPRLFHKLGCRTITIDNHATGGNALENARDSGIEGINCDIMNAPLPLHDNSVDCVLFADVIEHLIHSPRIPLSEFRRVLKKDGVCIATTPNAMRLSVRLRVLMGYSNWPYIGDYFDAPYHEGHHHEYTIDEFKYVFNESKYTLKKFVLTGTVATVNIRSFGSLQTRRRTGCSSDNNTHPIISLAKIPIYLLERLFPTLRPSMILVAGK